MSIRVRAGRGSKTGDAAVLAVEAEKSARAADIGKATRLFYVPAVLGYARDQAILDQEWIEGLESLFRVALRRDCKMAELCYRAGAALAAIHQHLRLPEQLKVGLPEPVAARPQDRGVYLHGDFNGDNVCYHRPSDRLVIVDWSAAPLFGGTPTYGSPYFDLLWFGHFFYCARPVRWLGTWKDQVWYRALVRGYESESGSRLPETEFHHYRAAAEPVFSAARQQMLRNARGIKRPVHALLLWRAGRRWRRDSLGQ